MDRKRKIVLIVGGAVIGLTILLLLNHYITNKKYTDRIPEIPESPTISPTVKEQLSTASKKAHRNPSAQNLGELGMAYHSSANYNEAAQCYQLAVERNTTDWKCYYYRGYLYKELGESDKVAENFNRVIELNPDADLAWYYLGEAYENLRKTELSEKAFSKIMGKKSIPGGITTTRFDNFPLGVYATFQLSKVYIETGRLDLAEESLKTLISTHELYGPAYRLLANVYSTKGAFSSGEKYILIANDLLPFSPPVDTLADQLTLMSRSELYLLKKIDEAGNNAYSNWALTLTEQGLKYFPDNQNLVSKAIEVYIWKNLNQKATELTDRNINANINNYNELVLRGMMFFERGMYNDAKKYLSKAWELKSEDFEIFISLSFSLWKTGDQQKAEEILTQSAEKNLDNAENLAAITYAFLRIEKYEKAKYYLNRLKQLAPNHPRIQKISGKIAESNGDSMAAISLYESSFTGNPKDVETINSLANLLIDKKLWVRFYQFYKEVIRQNPNNPVFLEKWGTFYMACPDKSLRNLDEAIEYLNRAFIHISSPPHIVLSAGKNLSVALLIKRDKENALKAVNKTINYAQRNNAPQNVKQELEKLRQDIQNL